MVEYTSFPTFSDPFELADIVSASLFPVAANALLRKKTTLYYPF